AEQAEGGRRALQERCGRFHVRGRQGQLHGERRASVYSRRRHGGGQDDLDAALGGPRGAGGRRGARATGRADSRGGDQGLSLGPQKATLTRPTRAAPNGGCFSISNAGTPDRRTRGSQCSPSLFLPLSLLRIRCVM